MSGVRFDALGSAKTDKSFVYTADFLAAIFTWGGIGFLVDRMVGTEPLLMVIGFIIGNVCGLYLLYIRSRDADGASHALDAHTNADPTPHRATRPNTTTDTS